MENVNSVAFISKIKTLSSIEKADKIELATCESWTSIVQKNIHKEGDLVLCITTDAVIPEVLALQWGVDNYLRKGNRVRTIRLKSVYSECILIPLSDLPFPKIEMNEGRDIMEGLGIFKYEPPAIQIQDGNGRKHKYHQNPNFHIYYKFPNQKNVPNMFNEDDEVVITRKIHGTNARYGIVKKNKLSILDRIKKFFGNKWTEYEYVYGSHNIEKGSDSQGFYSTDIWKEVSENYNIKDKLWKIIKSFSNIKDLGNGFVIYGEIYGQGIQGDKYSYSLKTKDIKFFDLEIDGDYMSDGVFQQTMRIMDLKIVDCLYSGFWSKESQEKFLYDNIEGTDIPHEGIVVKHISGDRQKVSKVINPNYHIYAEKQNVPDSH